MRPLEFENLSAAYGSRMVFRGLSLALDTGVYTLQGANGAGKSTLLRLLAGAQDPACGEIWIDGLSLKLQACAARKRLSYVPDESPIYPFMTGRDLLRFVGGVKRTSLDQTIEDIVEDFDLTPHLETRFDAMSLGTQKKMLLCAGFIGTPRVLLIDEPSNGLDHKSRDCLIRYLRDVGRQNMVLFTAHDADFVAATAAERIALEDLAVPSNPPQAL